MRTQLVHPRSSFSSGFFFIMISLLLLASLTFSSASALVPTAYSPKAASSSNGKGWTHISYSFQSDNLYATATRRNKALKLSRFTIASIPTGATINGIAVTVEGHTLGMQANVSLTYNGGANYTTSQLTALTGSDTVYTLGGPNDLWGRTWTPSNFTDANFGVRLVGSGSSGMLSVDQVQVLVYYNAPPTTIVLPPVSGPYAGTAGMTATLTLTADGSPIVGKTVNFYVGGNGVDGSGNCTGTSVGSATTQAGTGVATLVGASLAGITAGDYPYGACASFAGDGTYAASAITNDLSVIGTATTLVASPASGTYGNTTSLTGTLTLTSGGTPISGQHLNFFLFGNPLGSAATNGSGVATLPNVDLSQYDAGTSTDLMITFDGASSYNPSQGTADITINPRPITVTAVKSTKVYDGTTSSAQIPTITSGSLVTGDVSAFTETFDTPHVGTGKTLTPGGAVDDGNGGANYAPTFATVSTGVVNKANATVTADNQSKGVAQPDPVFTFQYSGLQNGETAADVSVQPTCGVIGPHSALGNYSIVCSGASDLDYSFSYVSGTLAVLNSGVSVTINGTLQGTYSLTSGNSLRQSYTNLDAGPVKLTSVDGASPIIGSERINLKSGTGFSSYSEFMGVAGSSLSDTYLFPWYNNATAGGVSSELRFANVGNASTIVTVTIAGVDRGTYPLGIDDSARVTYPDLDNGPVQVHSSDGVAIVVSMRVSLKKMPSFSSYTELLGLSASSTASTKYMFPWYNNAASGGLDSQLRFGNVGGGSTIVTVKIGGVVQGTYPLDPNQSTRISYNNIDNGPVEITSSGGVPIIASERINLKTLPSFNSYTELMGLPGVTLTETRYVFPIYTDTVASGLEGQLRFGNVGATNTTVTVKIGGVVQGTYDLIPNASTRIAFSGLDTGPVEVSSSGGVPIIASMRVNLSPNATYSSNAEMMGLSMGTGLGLPGNQLSTAYWFPWYNNVTAGGLDSQLRFGIP